MSDEPSGHLLILEAPPHPLILGAKEPTAPRAGTFDFHTATTFCISTSTISTMADRLQTHPATETIAQFAGTWSVAARKPGTASAGIGLPK